MCVYVYIDIYIFLCKYLLTYDTLYIDIDNNLFFTFVFVNNIHQNNSGEYIHSFLYIVIRCPAPPLRHAPIKIKYFHIFNTSKKVKINYTRIVVTLVRVRVQDNTTIPGTNWQTKIG